MTQRKDLAMASLHVEADPSVLERYLCDESSFRGHAEGLIRVRDPHQVGAVLRAASARGVPVTFSARRTSLTGAAIPLGGWVIALPETSSPDAVEIDVDARTATAPAHVLCADLETAAAAHGLFFGPDPTSRKECSVGGAVACNASGARSFAFGPWGEWVVGLTVVLASGDVLRLRRGEHPPVDGAFHLALADGMLRVPCPGPRRRDVKSALGYALYDPPDVVDLFVGSEGTLGYLHDVTVRLLPARPIFAALIFWPTEGPALDFVARLQATRGPDADPAGVAPMSVEWFDRRSLELAGARHPRFRVPADAAAALFVEQRHAPEDEEAVTSAWYEALIEAGAPDDEAWLRIPRTAADLDAFRDFRHAVPESVNDLARQRGLRKLGTDLAYPAGWLHRMAAHYRGALADLPAAVGPEAAAAFAAEHHRPLPRTLDSATFGHIGDNHLHVNLLPRDAAEAAAGRLLYYALARHCAAHGGAISGEHGVGKSKRDLLAELLPAADLEVMRAVKAALDPTNILGRGNVLPPLA